LKIAFLCNHTRTIIYKALSERLEELGHEIYWIATGSRWVREIAEPSGNILDVSDFSTTDTEGLELFEKHSHYSVERVISSDRILKERAARSGDAYLSSLFKSVSGFLAKNEVRLVFGELTFAHEYAAKAVCRYLGIGYLTPINARYPSDRFLFIADKPVDTGRASDLSEGELLCIQFLKGGKRPFYLDRVKINKLTTLKRYLLLSGNDLTMEPFGGFLYKRLKRSLYSGYKGVREVNGDYVYLPLHCSPESSVDILEINSDPLDFVRQVAETLPDGIRLAVKEHPLMERSSRFYRELSEITAVVLVDKDVESHILIRNSIGVVTLSGTASYEAGLYGIPAVVFSDEIFCELTKVKKCESFGETYDVLERLRSLKIPEGEASKFLAKLHSISYEGFCESPAVYADALGEENVSRVADAFRDVIGFYSSSKSETEDSICS